MAESVFSFKDERELMVELFKKVVALERALDFVDEKLDYLVDAERDRA